MATFAQKLPGNKHSLSQDTRQKIYNHLPEYDRKHKNEIIKKNITND